ncbi:MAG: hypothetical protein AB7N71_05455 [Phycisphaerae bacterium]
MKMSLVLLFVPLSCALAVSAAAQSTDSHREKIRELVQEIAARGERAAADAFLEAYLAPLEAALQQVADRPYEEQIRVVEALSRVTANLRLRVVRTELDEKDRESFDRIFSRERALVEDLFHDSDEVRMAALNRIPMEKDTMAGVLIAAKLRDWNAEITALALDKAMKLSDASILRGVRRFARDVLVMIENHGTGLSDPYVAIAYASFLDKAALILARNGDKEDTPLLLNILAQLNGEGIRRYAMELRNTVDALGAMGDERLAPVLLPLLSFGEIQRLPSLPSGQSVTRTTGDAALASLARIYGIDCAHLGMVRGDDASGVWGFVSDDDRGRAHLVFREWHRENAEKSASDRTPLAPVGERQP